MVLCRGLWGSFYVDALHWLHLCFSPRLTLLSLGLGQFKWMQYRSSKVCQ